MKRKKIRLKYKKERVLFSDMLPYELPFIFSNRYFYRFLVRNGIQIEKDRIVWNNQIAEGALEILAFIMGVDVSYMKSQGCITCDDKGLRNCFQTIPFTYRILHKPTKSRELSIIHPRNQILMVDFYDKYKSLMLYYCSIDKYSLRHPNKVACYFYYRDKLHKTLIGRKTDPLELYFNEYENLRTFFSYKRYNNIYKFYEDYRYQRAEKKFSRMIKFDIQSCFDSIYTHSISWAAGGGKEIYKDSFKNEDHTFASNWDRRMQLMNYNETNGIVIGPEFSRIFAEVILQHIDSSVSNLLKINNFEWEKDYVCYRYVDDYFFFYNDDNCRKLAMESFEKKLKEYKLSINSEKTNEFLRPFVTDITRAKIKIDNLIDSELKYHSNLEDNPDDDEANFDFASETIEKLILDRSSLDAALNDKSWIHLNSRYFNQTFKAILVESNVEAKDVINYSLSRIGNKLCSVIKKFDKTFRVLSETMNNEKFADDRISVSKVKNRREKMMVSFLVEILDIVFFLYASNKRVNSTLKVINVLNEIIIHLNNDYEIHDENIKKYNDTARDVVFKKIQDELSLILRTTSVESNTQLETLYFLIINKKLRSKYHFSEAELRKYLEHITKDTHLNALSIIILLYYYGNEQRYKGLKSELIEQQIKVRYKENSVGHMCKSAEFCILTLDMISCPYLSYQNKREISNYIGITELSLQKMLVYFKQQKYMFTKWTKIDVTKELSAKISQEVYS